MCARRTTSILCVLLGVCSFWLADPSLAAFGWDAATPAAPVRSAAFAAPQRIAFQETAPVANANPRNALQVVLKADKSTLKPGDELRFTVKVNRDCYVTLLYVSESGNVIVLWPTKDMGWNSRVHADRPVQVPDPNAQMRLQVDGRRPYERVFAVACTNPDVLIGKTDFIEDPRKPVRTLAIPADDLLDELRHRADTLPASIGWGTAQATVHVVAAKRDRESFVSSLSPKGETLLAVKDLNESITRKGYNWEAGVTSLSELPDKELRARCGLATDAKETDLSGASQLDEEDEFVLKGDEAPRPKAWDWRNVQGKDWTTPIREQKNCGACTVFATAAVVEISFQIQEKKAGSGIHLSEANIFFCGCGKCCNKGWGYSPAFEYVKNQGVMDQADYPYKPKDQDCNAQACQPSKAGKTITKIAGWIAIPDAEGAKNWISRVGPVCTGMTVYKDFFSYKKGVYKLATGENLGGHAIAIVGYNDEEGCWICKNSWGTGWGDHGYFKIGYDQCDIGSKVYPFVTAKPPISRGK